MMIQVDAETLRKLLDRVRDAAFTHHAHYNRRTKSWPFDDTIWRQADPYEFGLYETLRRALGERAP